MMPEVSDSCEMSQSREHFIPCKAQVIGLETVILAQATRFLASSCMDNQSLNVFTATGNVLCDTP